MYSATLYILFSVRYVHVHIHTHVRKRPQTEAGQEGAGGDVPDVPVSSAYCGQGALS